MPTPPNPAELNGDLASYVEKAVRERTETLQAENECLKAALAQSKAVETHLQQTHDRKDAFLAVLGHELRNPLGPLRNSAALCAMSTGDNPDLQTVSEIIERQVRTLAQMVDDLIDVSHISQGRIKLQKKPVCLSQLLEQVITDSQLAYREQGRELQLERPSHDIWVQGDSVRLTQVVTKALRYLSKSSPLGDTATGFSLSLVSLPQLREAVLRISDVGTGQETDVVPPSEQKAAVSGPPSEEHSLGMTLVRGLVDLHGGTLELSVPVAHRGGVVTIRLPWIESPLAENETCGSANTAATGRTFRMLIIDEHPDFLATMERLLGQMGHEVVSTATAENGLTLARQNCPDVIISAIGLKAMNGYEFARQVRSEPALNSKFLVAVTGFGQEDDHRRALAAGFDRHLTKPVAIEQLTQLLDCLGKA